MGIEPYAACKVYGPYKRNDGREHVVLVHKNGRKQTVSYPKFLWETTNGRYLQEDETVDHIDRDPLNNDMSNLQILKRSDHCKIDAMYTKPQTFVCDICNITFELSGRKLNDAICNRRKGKAGPYCSRSCAGVATHDPNRRVCHISKVEHCLIEKSPVQETVQVHPAKSENPRSMGIPS